MTLAILMLIPLLFGGQTQTAAERWIQYAESGELDRARQEMAANPEEAKAALVGLLAKFDSSVHSFRDKPEQRRVQYSQSLLDSGIKLSKILAETTGDAILQRRFQARQDRMDATKLLNDKQFQKALDLTESVRKVALEVEDKPFLFSTYLSSAYAYLNLEQQEKALTDCQTALRLAEEIGEPAKMALALLNLGSAYLHLGQVAASAPYSMRAAESAAKVGNKIWEANAWLNVGTAAVQQNQTEAAEKALTRALQLAKEAGDRLAEGRAYYDLGVVQRRMGHWQQAAESLERALEFIRTVDIRHSHDIDSYNYVEKDALEMLVDCYRQLKRGDAELAPLRARLDELKVVAEKEKSAAGHHHHD